MGDCVVKSPHLHVEKATRIERFDARRSKLQRLVAVLRRAIEVLTQDRTAPATIDEGAIMAGIQSQYTVEIRNRKLILAHFVIGAGAVIPGFGVIRIELNRFAEIHNRLAEI